MTKKHFIALADMIRRVNAERPDTAFSPYQILALSQFCAGQNPAFDRTRWLAYIAGDCGPNGGKR